MAEPTTDELELDSPEQRVARLDSLFEAWDDFRQETTAVGQAAALVTFANQFFHFKAEILSEWERDRVPVPSAYR